MSLMELTSIFGAKPVPDHKHPAGGASALRRARAYTAYIVCKLRMLAPYAAIELVLPGGSVIALLLWFWRRQKGNRASNPLGRLT